jgi:hypothetical protein
MRIEAPGCVFWIRPAPLTFTSGEYPDPEGRPIYVLTAYNPGGQIASDPTNALAGERLAAELEQRGLTWWPAAGGDPSWTHVEPGAALIDVDEDDVLALGTEFGQEAIFKLTPAERQVVGCADKRVTATGWSIDREAEEVAEDRTAPAVEVTVYTENLQVSGGLVAPKDYDDYISWVGLRDGILCTLQLDEGEIALHGDGQGGVLVKGSWNGPQGPFPVTIALQQLADAGVFESALEFVSGTWAADDVALLVAPFSYYNEFTVDGEEWSTDGQQAYPISPLSGGRHVLAVSTWEIGEGTPYSLSGESGAEVLMRIGPRYVTCSINGSEREYKTLDAADGEDAVAAFKAAIGATEINFVG